MSNDRVVYVVYNPEKGYRSARSNSRSYSKKFSSAIVYIAKHIAKRAANAGDYVIPVDMHIDPADLLVEVLRGK